MPGIVAGSGELATFLTPFVEVARSNEASPSSADFVVDKRLMRNERFLQFLAFGFCFNHERAKDALDWFVGCKEDWVRAGQEKIYLGLPPDDQNAFIAELLERVVKDAVARIDPARPLTMGISAGFDSRLLLHFLRKAGLRPSTYTFGQVGSFDFDFMKVLSRRMGLDTEFCDTSEMEWSWELERKAMSRQILPISPRILTMELMNRRYPNRVDVRGYLGDVLTGSKTSKSEPASWAAALTGFSNNNDTFRWQSLVPIANMLPGDAFVDANVLAFDVQLDLAYRQSQRIRLEQEPRLGNFIFPFEDARWVGFWLSRRRKHLAGQRRYINFIRSLGSEIFYDLQECSETSRRPLRQERMEKLYGANRTLVHQARAAKAMPKSPTEHFCMFACYKNNASFRHVVEQSLRRLRARDVFTRSFIDQTVRNFESGEVQSDRRLRGLVSVDLALEAGHFC
jgi:hypothetical protein